MAYFIIDSTLFKYKKLLPDIKLPVLGKDAIVIADGSPTSIEIYTWAQDKGIDINEVLFKGEYLYWPFEDYKKENTGGFFLGNSIDKMISLIKEGESMLVNGPIPYPVLFILSCSSQAPGSLNSFKTLQKTIRSHHMTIHTVVIDMNEYLSKAINNEWESMCDLLITYKNSIIKTCYIKELFNWFEACERSFNDYDYNVDDLGIFEYKYHAVKLRSAPPPFITRNLIYEDLSSIS